MSRNVERRRRYYDWSPPLATGRRVDPTATQHAQQPGTLGDGSLYIEGYSGDRDVM